MEARIWQGMFRQGQLHPGWESRHVLTTKSGLLAYPGMVSTLAQMCAKMRLVILKQLSPHGNDTSTVAKQRAPARRHQNWSAAPARCPRPLRQKGPRKGPQSRVTPSATAQPAGRCWTS